MLLYVLKSSACLAIFIVFYKLCLEKTSAHTFKRFYLLTIILISIGIPFITLIEYIEVQPVTSNFIPEFNISNPKEVIESKRFIDYLPTILWSIYILGVIIFFFRFLRNLYRLFIKIRTNPKQKSNTFFLVLLQELVNPHTFLNYIFLNKTQYETNQIPKEVFIHEQTHAKQKHALDIIFIEVLQIPFWFNPLFYLIKKDIKLNHEFLADLAVIKTGFDTKHYQRLLLAFSSNAANNQLANAINYSLIKKRFTVMKTKTSKTALRLRTLTILPLLAILIYSFSHKKTVLREKSVFKKEEIPQLLLPQEKEKRSSLSDIDKELEAFNKLKINYPEGSNLKKEPVLEILFNPNIYRLNGKTTSLPALKNDFIKVTNSQKSDLRIKAEGGINMSLINKIMTLLKGNLLKIKLDKAAYLIEDRYTNQNQQKATPEEIEEYNIIIQKINSYPENKRIIKLKDFDRLKFIYNKMSDEQKANAEPLPNFPPPPPPAPIPVNASPEKKAKYQKVIDTYEKKYKRKVHQARTDDGENINIIVEEEKYEEPHTPKSLNSDPNQENKSHEDILKNQTINLTPMNNPSSPWKITVGVSATSLTLNGNHNIKRKFSQKDLEQYNSLVEKFNILPQDKKIVSVADYSKLYELYLLIPEEKKASLKPFPSFLVPPKSDEEIVLEMINQSGTTCFVNDEKTTKEKAIELINQKKELQINSEQKEGNSFVKIYTKDFKK